MKKYLEQNDHPVIAVDVIILNDKDQILLTKRNVEPQKDSWSIVGERIKIDDDSIEYTIKRGAKEECNIVVEPEYLVDVLANPRIEPPADPRFYVVQVLYVARFVGGTPTATREVSEFAWKDLDEALQVDLAFNHRQLLQIYKEAKEKNKLIPAERTKFTEYYGKAFNYVNNAFPRMAIDNIILNEKNEVLLARRSQWPYVGHWDFPGGHIYVNEKVKDCAKREAKEELGVDVEVW
jgi:ADP-ribose pyrophosphatase YjhB (NUDIX family)